MLTVVAPVRSREAKEAGAVGIVVAGEDGVRAVDVVDLLRGRAAEEGDGCGQRDGAADDELHGYLRIPCGLLREIMMAAAAEAARVGEACGCLKNQEQP